MSATTPHNHLGTNVPTGELSEKKDYGAPEKRAPVEDEEEDEDMDALIEELESQDAQIDDEEEEEAVAGGARNVPEELLQTSWVPLDSFLSYMDTNLIAEHAMVLQLRRLPSVGRSLV